MNRQRTGRATGLVISLLLLTTVRAEAKSLNGLPLPAPGKIGSHFSQVVGWKLGEQPKAPKGFTVTKFAGDLSNPRWIYVAPNNDVFIAESDGSSSADRITLFRDKNSDGQPDQREVFKTGLNQPFGMLVLGDSFYVGNTDGLIKFPYKAGDTKLGGDKGQKILDLPAGGYNNHWTRQLLASLDGKKIFVTVGSGSNVGENGMDNEKRRANILEVNPDGTGERIYASGLRNPIGLGYSPESKKLWTVVNERDNLGDDLVPDYTTEVKDGGFYGWPYSYFGQHVDTRVQPQKPELVKSAIVPDVSLGSHTASLGLAFYNGSSFPEHYRNGLFIGQHGSWNRSSLVGYKVVFIPFKAGRPTGPPEDFLTGFIKDATTYQVYGRPVGVAVQKDGSLLVADDSGKTIWRVTAAK